MITEDAIVDQLTERVSGRVTSVVKETLSEIVQQEISIALAKALDHGQFYRTMNEEVIESIGTIYSEIKSVKSSLNADSSTESLSLLNESDSILDGIIKATEHATLKILDYLENMQQELNDLRSIIEPGGPAAASGNLDRLERVILNVMTELSFQDLTGQQVKRVIQSLKKVEDIVFNVYVTSAVLKKSKEQSPEQGIAEIREKVKGLIDDAKGNKTAIDQEGVDSILAQLDT
jgi:chemotaxis protein CheZ